MKSGIIKGLCLFVLSAVITNGVSVKAVEGVCLAPIGDGTETVTQEQPIVLKAMGSLMFGGTVVKDNNGETFHGDHGYAQYFIPSNAREYPLIMWHGIGQSGKSWETTPDGREGFMQIFTRRDYPVYIIDQPRRGRAGYTRAKAPNPDSVPTTARESGVWDAFRNGVWTPPEKARLFPGVQFPRDAVAIDQFFRQQTPDTGIEPYTPEHRWFLGRTMAALLAQSGPSVLLTHSHSGQYGWYSAMSDEQHLIKGIVAYEPGAFVFPEGEEPDTVPAKAEQVDYFMAPQLVSSEAFKKLTRMPILIIYGDNISREPSEIFNVDLWRIASIRAKQFVDAVNRHGGEARLVFLPDLGIKGNTHAPFADLNNVQIADHLEIFLQEKGLNSRNNAYTGPKKAKVNSVTIPLQ